MSAAAPHPAALRLAATALALLLAAGPAAAQKMYRWVDEDGVTVYSQTPPEQDRAATIEKDAAPSEQEQTRARERVDAINTDAFDRREDLRARHVEAAEAARAAAQRQDACARARQNMETIETLGARRLGMPDGEYRTLSDEERTRLRAEAQGQIDTHCK